MYILIHQHDDHRLENKLAFGLTYLEEVLKEIGKPVDLRYDMPKYYYGFYVYKINWGDNPTLQYVDHNPDSSD